MDLSIALSGCSPEEARAAARRIAAVLAGQPIAIEYLYLQDPGAPAPEPGEPALETVPLKRAACGEQLRAALAAARGAWLITLEAPTYDDASLIFSFWHRRHDGDLLVASRYVWGGSYDMPRLRALLSRTLNGLYRKGLSVPVCDLSSARRMYRTRLLRQVPIESDDYDVLMETLLRVMSKGGAVCETPWHFASTHHRDAPRAWWRLFRACLTTFRRMHALRNSVDFPDYDYRAYDSRIWLQRYWQRRRFAIIREFAGFHPKILDIGCGSSRIISTRPEMVALDLNFNRLRFLRRSNPRRLQGTAGALPFADNAFDAVITSQVIEHTPERNCIAEAARVLKPGGILVAGTPDYATFWWPITEKIYGWVKRGGYAGEHITHYTFDSLREEIESAGCEVLGHRYIGGGELIMQARKRG